MPIRLIDPAEPTEKKRHTRVAQLVDRMLALHQQLAKAKSPPDRSALQAQLAATDRQIDQLVYELYGLTDDEIRIVEEGTAK
jgi:hypothetical protein